MGGYKSRSLSGMLKRNLTIRENMYKFESKSSKCNKTIIAIANEGDSLYEMYDNLRKLRIRPVETQIMYALYKYGPLAVNINGDFFATYGGGILRHQSCSSSKRTNHVVVIVGYTVETSLPGVNETVWVLRNSQNSDEGESAKGFH